MNISAETRHPYSFEIPDFIDDMGLSLYAYRLYGHFKCVCDNSSDGKCSDDARTIREKCRMTSAQIEFAKSELIARGVISFRRAVPNANQPEIVTIRKPKGDAG